jgi:hypothetical protein
LKTGGDVPNTTYAKALAKSASMYSAKHGQKVYGYTHNWRRIARSAFGSISMIASCDKTADVNIAKSQGYATALVVAEFKNGAKVFAKDGIKIVPCPSQVADMNGRDYKCSDCMLCANDKKLRQFDLTVGFMAHGTKAKLLKASLA